MRVIVFGASGRVGLHLVEAVLADPGLDLAAAVVSPQSHQLGKRVAGGSLEYRAADPEINAHCDVIVDFSTPKASIDLQRILDRKPIPVVVGTTGFSRGQEDDLKGAARHRPILASANFAVGFEAFVQTAAVFAGLHPGAEASVDDHVIMLQNSSINHHARIGRFATVSAGVTVLGAVDVGEGAFLSGGASIAPYVKVGAGALIGLGSTVIRDVAAGSVVVGNPARELPSSRYDVRKT